MRLDPEERLFENITSKTNKVWSVEVQENKETKDLFIEIPSDALAQIGWDIGDELIWNELPGGTWEITKK